MRLLRGTGIPLGHTRHPKSSFLGIDSGNVAQFGTRRASKINLSFYFGAVRIVSFGSNKIFRVPAGAARWKEDSSPSANTRPSSTGGLLPMTAYKGTDVTRSWGASFCRMAPLAITPEPFGI